jgi:hypothetical protein
VRALSAAEAETKKEIIGVLFLLDCQRLRAGETGHKIIAQIAPAPVRIHKVDFLQNKNGEHG